MNSNFGARQKKYNLNKIQAFQSIALRRLSNASPYVSGLTLHNDSVMTTILDEARVFYKRFHGRLQSHPCPIVRISMPLHLLAAV